MAEGDHVVCPPGRRHEEGRPREAQGIDNPLLPADASAHQLHGAEQDDEEHRIDAREHDNAEQGAAARKVKPVPSVNRHVAKHGGQQAGDRQRRLHAIEAVRPYEGAGQEDQCSDERRRPRSIGRLGKDPFGQRCGQKSAKRIEQPVKDEDVADAADAFTVAQPEKPGAQEGPQRLEAIGQGRSVAGNALAQGNVAGDRQHVVAVVEHRLVEKGSGAGRRWPGRHTGQR